MFSGDTCMSLVRRWWLSPWFSLWDKHGLLRILFATSQKCPSFFFRLAYMYLGAFHCWQWKAHGVVVRPQSQFWKKLNIVFKCRSAFNFFDYLVIFCSKTFTVKPLVATTSPQWPVFQNMKHFPVKSLYLESRLSYHLSWATATTVTSVLNEANLWLNMVQ